MGKLSSLKKNNRGASLLAVLITLIFVAIIGVVITEITITNIQMKSVEQKSKENFYSAETAMKELSAAIGDLATSSMSSAYNEVILTDGVLSGDAAKQKFQKLYMDQLLNVMWSNTSSAKYTYKTDDNPNEAEMTKADYANNTLELFYLIGRYDAAAANIPDYLSVEGTPSAPDADGMVTMTINGGGELKYSTAGDFYLDFEKGTFTLKDVFVSYTDKADYNTSIKTDIVLRTPTVGIGGSGGTTKDYMKYSLLADNGIKMNASHVTVNGNVYSGAGGIVSDKNYYDGTDVTAESKFTGNKIITRGDIVLRSNTKLSVGNGANSYIWAENVSTEGTNSTEAIDRFTGILSLSGTCYISDDITLNAANSKVELAGKYYGYNFQKDYTQKKDTTDSSFSSAMIINAKNTSLDMTGLDYLLLAGRTYISKGSVGNKDNLNDIALGESVSIRTDQIAYAVPETYLDVTAEGGKTYTAKFSETGKSRYSLYAGVDDIMDYLDPDKPLVTYYYTVTGSPEALHRFYLNFKSEQKANDFYTAIYGNNGSSINGNAIAYAGENAIKISDSMQYTLKGDLMYADADGDYNAVGVTINESAWKPDTGAYWNFADQLAKQYKSLQLSLQDVDSSVTSSNVRFTADGMDVDAVDKTLSPYVPTIVDFDKLKADHAGETVVTNTEDGEAVILSGQDSYTVLASPSVQKGIIVAAGDVILQGNFCGMIIAGGDIRFDYSGSVISADEVMVAKMFSEDQAKEDPVFTKYFYGFETAGDSFAGQIDQKDYLGYENWTKNYES